MATEISRKRLEYAADAFLKMMSRQFIIANPGEAANPVRALDSYSPQQRSMLMKCVGAAIKSTRDEADAAFQAWLDLQAAAQNSASGDQ
jgi:hypothetical protein